MRNHSQKTIYKNVRQYLIFGGLFLLMTTNDILLGLQVFSEIDIPILLTISLFFKSTLFVGVGLLLYQHRSLIERSEIDILTKAYNREIFFCHLDQLISSQGGGRAREDISIILFDLDAFKTINDNLGHHIGDRVLAQVSNTTQTVIRHDDIFARLGGEEFGIVLPRTSVDEAVKLAERLRGAINAAAARAYSVSASFGVAAWNEKETVDQLYARADALMYRAKHEGKNRVVGE